MTAQYRLDYDENGARQVCDEIAPTAAPRGKTDKAKRRRRRIPSSVQTAITVVICGGVFFCCRPLRTRRLASARFHWRVCR